MKSLYFIWFTFELFCFLQAHNLPEDSQTDTEELLNREKRDDFLSSILKTIPFFDLQPSRSSLKDEDDPNDTPEGEEQIQPTSSAVALVQSLQNSSFLVPSRSYIFASSISPTIGSVFQSTNAIKVSRTPSLSLTSLFGSSSASHFYGAIPLFTVSDKILFTSSMHNEKTLPVIATQSLEVLHSSKSALNVLSRNSLKLRSSSTISPSSGKMQLVTASTKEIIPVIQMMIMSTGDNPKTGPKLPDEIGYGTTIGHIANSEEMEIKNIRYLYSNVLIPIMSGICGALLLTLAIMVYRCIRRRKLQKVRYYGGKPNSALYRLDEMSLLSELSSDEED